MIKYERHGDIDVVFLSGQLVMSNAVDIRETIKSIIETSKGKLILDMQAVDFVDSSGLSVLVFILKRLREKQSEMVLSQLQPNVQNLIELTRLNQVFKIFLTFDAAMAYFSS